MIKGTDYIWEVLEKYPNARRIFEKHGMGCHLCIASNAETIASGAKMHGISLNVLLEELNEVCK
jgi:hybrid cluster-associated redox disulfide protein